MSCRSAAAGSTASARGLDATHFLQRFTPRRPRKFVAMLERGEKIHD
ncbi:MAG TPA: hypothetical protein VG458_09070 [Solirubrobacterales bacterium]|nr:hypothetical protein [Solirubrobacterales bacterium]